MLLPFRPSQGDSGIEAVPLPYKPPMDGTLDGALILQNLVDAPEGENVPGQSGGRIVPVKSTPDGPTAASQTNPQLAQAPNGGGPQRLESRPPLIPSVRYSSPVDPDALRLQGRGAVHSTEPPPGSTEYEAAMNIAIGRPVHLPDGSTIPDASSPTGKVMSPTSDLDKVAAAGREAGAEYRASLANPSTAENAIVSLATKSRPGSGTRRHVRPSTRSR